MTYLALLAFGGAAVIGLMMAGTIFTGRLAPWLLSLLHAAAGAAGLLLLLTAAITGVGGRKEMLIFVIMLFTALVGFYMALVMHRGGALPTKGLVLSHAAMGVVGVLLLFALTVGLMSFGGY